MLSIGIHIEEGCLNVAALSYKNRTFNLEDGFSIPFSSPFDERARHLELAQALKSLQEKYKNQLVRLCFALPQNQISCFASTFPFTEKFKIMKTLPFEIEENTLFQSDNVFFDGRISSPEKAGSSEVVSFVTLKENVKNFLAPLKQLKIEPYLLSAEGSALASFVEEWNRATGSSTVTASSQIYIHIGLKSSLGLFFKEGKLRNIFHFNWNYGVILEEMEKKYKLSFQEAQEQFFERAFVLTEREGFTREQVFFSDMIQSHLKSLIQELGLHRLSAEAKEETHFKEIFLMGPGSVIKNLSAFLSLKLSLSVYRMKPMEPLFPFKKEDPGNLIALGLAMEGLKRPPYTGLNLIHSLQKSKKRLFGTKWLAIGLVFLSVIIYTFVRNQEARNLEEKIHQVFVEYGKKIAFIRESRLDKDKVRNFLEEKGKNKANMEKINAMLLKSGPMDHLKTLTAQLKKLAENGNLKITSMEIDERQIHIQGFISENFTSQLKLKLTGLGKNNSLKDLSAQNKSETKNSSLLEKSEDSPEPPSGDKATEKIAILPQPSEGASSKSLIQKGGLSVSDTKSSSIENKLENRDKKENIISKSSKDKQPPSKGESSSQEESGSTEDKKEDDFQGIFFSYSFILKKDL